MVFLEQIEKRADASMPIKEIERYNMHRCANALAHYIIEAFPPQERKLGNMDIYESKLIVFSFEDWRSFVQGMRSTMTPEQQQADLWLEVFEKITELGPQMNPSLSDWLLQNIKIEKK